MIASYFGVWEPPGAGDQTYDDAPPTGSGGSRDYTALVAMFPGGVIR